MQHEPFYATMLDAAAIASAIMSVIAIITSCWFFRLSQIHSQESKANEIKTGQLLDEIKAAIRDLVLKLIDRLPQVAAADAHGDAITAADHEKLRRELHSETLAELANILRGYGVRERVDEIARKVGEVNTKADDKLSQALERPSADMVSDMGAFFATARSTVARARNVLDYLEPKYGHINAIQVLRRAKSSGLVDYDGALGTDTLVRYTNREARYAGP